MQKFRHKTVLGDFRHSTNCCFFSKLTIFLLVSWYLLYGNLLINAIIFVAFTTINLVIFPNQLKKIRSFVLYSTIAMATIWVVFSMPKYISSTSRLSEFMYVFFQALFRLLGLLMVGIFFLGSTSTSELISSLQKFPNFSKFSIYLVLAMNTTAYFISSIGEIRQCFKMRFGQHSRFKAIVPVMSSLVYDAMVTLSNCKRIFYLYGDRIESILLRHPTLSMSIPPHAISLEVSFKRIAYSPSQNVLENIHLYLSQGNIALISGKNGAGKTTLFDALCSIIPLVLNGTADGQILLNDKPLIPGQIDYVLQHAENSFFYDTIGRQLAHLPSFIIDEFFFDCAFSSESAFNRPISDLSLGQRKRVSLISALLSPSCICLLDEPTAFLDDQSFLIFLSLLKSVFFRKIIIIISHDYRLRDVCNIFFEIRNESLFTETPRDLQYSSTCHYSIDVTSRTNQLLEITDLIYEKLEINFILKIPSLRLFSPQILSIVGPNGSGKTTLGKLIIEQSIHPSSASFKFSSSLNCVMMSHEPFRQFYTLNVLDELLYNVQRTHQNINKAKYFLHTLGLNDFTESVPHLLSGGLQRLVLICALLMGKPDIIILDEPFGFLDDMNTENLCKLLHMYSNDFGSCIIINDHSSKTVANLATDIFYISN